MSFYRISFQKMQVVIRIFNATYHPPSQTDKYYFNYLDKALDTYIKYEKILLVRDFNTEIRGYYKEPFLDEHEIT